jgi:hypothetical protein
MWGADNKRVILPQLLGGLASTTALALLLPFANCRQHVLHTLQRLSSPRCVVYVQPLVQPS